MTTGDTPQGEDMSRRRCLSALGAGLAALALPLPVAAAGRRPPNIVMIVADDLGSTDLGCYGATDLRTPHLDALAAHGVRFTDHYVTAPACTPSRASLLTGREHARALQRNVGMEAEETTLAELLRASGYHTAVYGKWHLGIPAAVSPLAQGFDEFVGFKVGAIDNYSHSYYWGAGVGHRLWKDDAEYHEDGTYFPDLVTREATRFIERSGDHPFFLYLPYNQPHYPLQPTVTSLQQVAHITDPARRQYAACVQVLDDALGRIVGAIAAQGLTRDTIVLFLSDHGHSTEPDSLSGGRSTPYRGNKGTLLEGGIRVPCVVSWPGQYPEGIVRHQLTSSLDWFPTLAAHAGASTAGLTLDGRDLQSVISSPQATAHAALCWTYGDLWAVREGPWKLMGGGEGEISLYNLDDDPGEMHDLRSQRHDRFRHLAEVRNNWAESLRADPTVIRELGL
ncbi:MAG: sulfatase-like hydrolase/transferase [bacterium]|nr:sulfatase-like hydrolase/transferase [bacterium]